MAIKVKLVDMGVKVQRPDYDSPAKATKKKTVVEYPTISLNSKNVPGLEKLTLDSKCRLVFEAEVTSLAEPSQWDMDRGGMMKGDVTAQFKLVKGELMAIGGTAANYESASKEAAENE